ncbi:MAG: ATP-binding cassette domain-containing protein [Patescibacteria group bacterium]
MLTISNLSVQRAGKSVLLDFSLQLAAGELVAVVGPNGVGKSTLALALLGHPDCMITSGQVDLDGQDLLSLKTAERAKLGLFLAHQEPPAIAGVTLASVLRAASDATRSTPWSTAEFFDRLRAVTVRLGLGTDFVNRDLHVGLSGGEKKRAELLALLVLQPKYAILDEIDAGMDTEARTLTQEVLAELRAAGTGCLVISHNESFIHGLNATCQLSLQSLSGDKRL